MRWPIGNPTRYAFVLTSEGLELGASDPGIRPVRVPLPEGVIAPSAELSGFVLHDVEALKAALKECLQRFGRRVRRAHLALDGLLVRTLTLPIPFVPPPEELALAVRSEAERYRAFSGSEVASDFALLSSDDAELTVLLAAARREVIDQIVSVFEGERIAVASVEPAPLALLRALAERAQPQESFGLISVFPQQMHVSTWHGDALQNWRTLYTSAAALKDGDAVAIAEATLDLQRSLVSLGGGSWLLVGVPEPLREALPAPPGVSVETFAMGEAHEGSATLEGATRYGPEQGPFAFNLRHDRLKPPRPKVSRGVGIPMAFLAIFALALGLNVWLSKAAQRHEAEAARLQGEAEKLQAQLAAPDRRHESETALLEALDRSEAVVSLFKRFQDDTPHDVWLSRTILGSDSEVEIQGYALSQEGPLSLAEALGRSPSLSEIQVPELAEADWRGVPVYRFRLVATFTPQGRFRP